MNELVFPQLGYLADVVSPKQVAFFFMPDFNIPGWMNTLEKYLRYAVDTIVFSHNGNYEDPLETGDQESVRFALKYLQVIDHHKPHNCDM